MSNLLEGIKALTADINKNYDIIDILLRENKDIWFNFQKMKYR